MAAGADVPQIAELRGLWRRSLLAWPDGRRDTTTEVSWLQGPRMYIDLRQPAGRTGWPTARCLRDLRPADLLRLAAQEGFAGGLFYEQRYFEWRRLIDFQPKAVYSDAGLLWFEENRMVEVGRDIPYVEHWHRDPAVLGATCALRLQDARDGRAGMLLRVGGVFMFARDRGVAPPAETHLTDCVRGADTLAQAQDLVDCEIAFGHVGREGWRIAHSTLPYRQGRLLALHVQGGEGNVRTADVSPQGEPIQREWTVLEAEGDLAALYDPEGLPA